MIITAPPPPGAIYRRAFALIAVGGLLVTFTALAAGVGPPGSFVVGLVLATVFQQTVLAAGWGALGPGKVMWRIPLSLGWACSMGLAIGLPIGLVGEGIIGLVCALAMAGLWVIALFPLWLFAFVFGVRLRYQGELGETKRAGDRQFGISQLMAFTGFVAVVLGAGRLIVAFGLMPAPDSQVGLLLLLLAASQVLISLPLILGSLLPARVAPAILGGLIFGAVITFAELQVIPLALNANGLPPMVVEILVWMNILSAVWVLVFSAVIRGSGYHFGMPGEPGIRYVGPVEQQNSNRTAPIVYLTSQPEQRPPGEVIHISE